MYSRAAKRNTHRKGKSTYVFHPDECPNKQDCTPESSLGPFVYAKSETNPRLYPPIPRDSKRFKDLANQRSASERVNFINDTYNLDGCCRNADYGLIRLTLANIAHHASIRYKEADTEKAPYLRLRACLKIRDRCEKVRERAIIFQNLKGIAGYWLKILGNFSRSRAFAADLRIFKQALKDLLEEKTAKVRPGIENTS